ncbi:hypothetical protein L6452_40683 [Arctium lappa]|uniref:Uncharacterized protein n=1 Tax=Arctium lappa TaxID=4217 RepID=A0ACB8XMZ4_ARCLA|nr:hypothetical protein L6452_40683 [Arctium lappa]
MSLSRSPNPYFFPEFGRRRLSLGLSSYQDALGPHPRPASLLKIRTRVSSGLHSGAMSWTWALPTSPGNRLLPLDLACSMLFAIRCIRGENEVIEEEDDIVFINGVVEGGIGSGSSCRHMEGGLKWMVGRLNRRDRY